MWRAAARQLSRQRLQRVQGFRLEANLLSVSQICGCRRSASSATARDPVTERPTDREPSIEARWRLQPAASTSPALPLRPPAAAACLLPLRSQLDKTLDAALINVVNLPWLFWQGSPVDTSLDGGELRLKYRDVATLDYNRTFASAAEVVDDVDIDEHHSALLVPAELSIKSQLKEEKLKKKKKHELHKRQLKIETEAWLNTAAEYKHLVVEMCRKSLAPNLPFAQALLLGWFEPLRDAILAEINGFESKEYREHRAIYGPFMRQLPADMLAVITMHKLLGLIMSDQENGCVKVLHAALQIGEAVEQEAGIYKFLKSKKKKKKKKEELKSNAGAGKSNIDESVEGLTEAELQSAKKMQDKLKKKVKNLVKRQKLRMVGSVLRHANGGEPWGPSIQAKVGSRLLELMLETAFVRPPADQTAHDISELRPAFKHSLKNYPLKSRVNRIYGVIECDPLVMREVDKSAKHMVMPYMPMLVEPRPWESFSDGGYLHLKASMMRTHGAKEQQDTMKVTPPENMRTVIQALNSLGKTGWRINGSVLDVLERIWSDGGCLADIVDATSLPLPTKPQTEDKDILKIWRMETSKIKRINSERHSMRCDIELKLAVARKFKDEEAFYYPHNLDFRGRAYPMHPNLNHLGSDMCRGILEFAEGRALGPNGLRWLKIHLANLYGGKVGKMSFAGRVSYVDTHMDKIFDSAERPLEGQRWWLEAEDPFQCLATCMEIRRAIVSGSPETCVSYLPVHQDGSCNGLQHYAALGRDRNGAASVNLIACDQPADVYSGIAARVRDIMEKDALKDPLTSRSAASARLLLGEIDRKLVKQTVMTSVYGVTFVGARMQIMNRLKERGSIADQTEMYRASCYAAKTTMDALGEMFKEARCIMNWLGDCAKIVASSGESVKWITPLGLPVVQPYRKPGRHLVKTSLQVLALRNLDRNQPVLVQRQRSAFPPNFVHSLDSSHMMMTALACEEAGLAFAGVHDSYWTHAGNVEHINSLLREKFVELYSQPILENLLKDFQQQFPNLNFPDVPARGILDLKEVLKAPYFFN